MHGMAQPLHASMPSTSRAFAAAAVNQMALIKQLRERSGAPISDVKVCSCCCKHKRLATGVDARTGRSMCRGACNCVVQHGSDVAHESSLHASIQLARMACMQLIHLLLPAELPGEERLGSRQGV